VTLVNVFQRSLSLQLCQLRQASKRLLHNQPTAEQLQTRQQAPVPARRRRGGKSRQPGGVAHQRQQRLTPAELPPAEQRACKREALLAALLFAAHPVHTEAVAGLVGHAELLSAAFFAAALLVYMQAGGDCGIYTVAEARSGLPRQDWRQWPLVAAALALTLAAAFAKEIGITAVSITAAA